MAAILHVFTPRKKGKHKNEYCKVPAEKKRFIYHLQNKSWENYFAALRRMYLRTVSDSTGFPQRVFCIEGHVRFFSVLLSGCLYTTTG